MSGPPGIGRPRLTSAPWANTATPLGMVAMRLTLFPPGRVGGRLAPFTGLQMQASQGHGIAHLLEVMNTYEEDVQLGFAAGGDGAADSGKVRFSRVSVSLRRKGNGLFPLAKLGNAMRLKPWPTQVPGSSVRGPSSACNAAEGAEARNASVGVVAESARFALTSRPA